jgi:hypothetical protein
MATWLDKIAERYQEKMAGADADAGVWEGEEL